VASALAGARLDQDRLPRLRSAAQLLHRPASVRDPVELARAIAGAQAQDQYAGPLTFRSRSRGLTAADINRARTEDRSLLRTWLMRMTMHLVPSDDAGWLLPLFEPGIEKWSRRRLQQLGMPDSTQERALAAIRRALEAEGPTTRPDATRLHITLLAVTSGLAFLGPDRGRSTCLVLRHDWLGKPARFEREAALAELARRYLGAFGPATERDFAYWSGLGLREVRTGLGEIAAELTESRLGEETLLSLQGARDRLPPAGQLRLLGAFDAYMLGYRSRDFAVPAEGVAAVKEGGGGWIRPVIVEDGRVIGGWRSVRTDRGLEISLDPLRPLSAARRSAIDAEIEDIGRFEGLPARLAG
jgi:Winged helix DNA-binding domain